MVKPMAQQYYEGIGRRKEASARVRLYPGGTGQMTVLGTAGVEKDGRDYFPRSGDVEIIYEPLRVLGAENAYDITVHVFGGGISGQRDAVKLGVARALLKVDPDVKPALKAESFLTRDSRVKERKKPGLKRARKAPTYTKR
jgi:small subunit ribosomal protein S9